jgi:hypothetical protein
MQKLLFWDYREIETVRGFARMLQQPRKHTENPLFIADRPWENGNMQLYGSVIKPPDGPFQLWYSVIHRPWNMYLAYAESDDGIVWRKPELSVFEYEGQKTNIIFTANPHGPAIIYDPDDPRPGWRYKMVAGADPSGCITAYYSPDGISWRPARGAHRRLAPAGWPVIGTNPDCPMGLLRAPDGRYVIYHRLHGFGRRVFRSESWDFVYWTGEPRLVLEPDAGDPPQTQFYGLGSTAYGPFEIGTLWIFHTDEEDLLPGKSHGYQEAELAYARSGYAWHRAAQGTPFIPHGGPGEWDRGNLQCASAPVFLPDEIRYYYAGTDMRHQKRWELEPQTAGLGLATLKPDRFIALCAGRDPAELITVSFPLAGELFVNAATRPAGWIRVELLRGDKEPIAGYAGSACVPVSGDSISHHVRWESGDTALPIGETVRLRVLAQDADLYSLYSVAPGEEPVYHKFTVVRP